MIHYNKDAMKEYVPYIEKWDAPSQRVFNGKVVEVDRLERSEQNLLNTQASYMNLIRGQKTWNG